MIRLWPFLQLALAAQLPSAPHGDAPILWFRTAAAPAADERALVDAVATYTRDLGVTIVAGPDAPQAGTDAAREASKIVRAHGARIAFWCERRAGARVAVLTIVGADGQLQIHGIDEPPGDEPELNRATALKLRAILVEATRPPADAPAAPPAAAPPAPPASPAADTVGVRAGASTAGSGNAGRLYAAAGYRVAAAVDAGPVRQGVALEAGAKLGRFVELGAATELSLPIEGHVTNGDVSVFDVPLAAVARVMHRRERLAFGLGASAALHVLSASATTTDGRRTRSSSLAAGAGVEAVARLRLTGTLAGELRITADVPLPATRYSVLDTPALELGTRVGVGIGLVFPYSPGPPP